MVGANDSGSGCRLEDGDELGGALDTGDMDLLKDQQVFIARYDIFDLIQHVTCHQIIVTRNPINSWQGARLEGQLLR